MLKTKARTKDWDFILKDSQGPRRVGDYKQFAVLVIIIIIILFIYIAPACRMTSEALKVNAA